MIVLHDLTTVYQYTASRESDGKNPLILLMTTPEATVP